MPLLTVPTQLTSEAIGSAWDEVWPQLPKPLHLEGKEGAITCEIDGALVGEMVMPAPIPDNEVDGPASASWLWPGATSELKGYGAHIVVFASGAESAVIGFRAMTRFAAATVHGTGALGVYMGGAGIVIRANVFVEMAQQFNTRIPLWIDLRCVKSATGESGLFTVGLNQFDLMEIEIPSSKLTCGDLRMWTMDLASWLVEAKPTIKAGETVGMSADQRVAVEHAPSMVGRDGPVMRLTGI